MNSKRFIHRIALVFIAASSGFANPPETESGAILSHIPRERVQSSGLAAVGYSKRRHILEIEFTNGTVYRYVDVPPSVYRDLMSAESKTGYYALHIKRNYHSYRVRPRVKDQPAN
jgi:KTSC domain-containing protein